MNVLVVDEEIPWPLDTGKKIRTHNLLRRLEKKFSITYVCYGEAADSIPGMERTRLVTIPSTILPQKGVRFYLSLLGNLLSSRPYVVQRHYSERFVGVVDQLIQSGSFDLIHCEWTPYTENIRKHVERIPSVLSAHNVEAQIWERYWLTERNFLKRIYIYVQWQKLLKYEMYWSPKYREISVVSGPDRLVFENRYGCRRVNVVPNGVDQEYFAPRKDISPAPHSLVFTGSMDWRPNQDGVRYFIRDVLPLIRKRLPDVSFTVVGRNPPDWLVAMAESIPGVFITGTVDDVRPYIAASSLYVVPLRVGGGSRLKILEAMSMEKIVLSTSLGAEGLDVSDGENIILRDTPETMADAACTILDDTSAFQSVGSAGRRLVLDRYTWDAIAVQLDKVWERAAG